MALNPITSLLPDGRIRMDWTPDLSGLGYRFYRDGVAVSIGTKASQSFTRFAAETDGRTHRYGLRMLGEIGPLETSEYPPPVVEPPPPPPPPPPPAVGLSPIGWFKNSWPGWWPPTNIDKYGIAAAYGPIPSSFKGVPIRYFTAVTCYPKPNDTNGISAEAALAAGWVLKDASGNPIKRGAPYTTGYVADVGDAGYRQAFADWLIAKLTEYGHKGAWVDDSNPRVLSLTGGVRPAKYPTDAAYEDAAAGFIAYVHGRLTPLLDVWNTAVPADNTGALTQAWWTRIGPNAGGLCIEYWMTVPGRTSHRRVGGEWWNNWDGYRALHGICKTAGCHFFGMNGNGEPNTQEYVLATFLLDWDGSTGSCSWNKLGSGGVEKDDPWTAVCDRAIALGQPTASAVKAGNMWTRSFQGGTVTVDPAVGTASIVNG